MANLIDFIEQSSQGAGFVYKNSKGIYYFDGTSFKSAGEDAEFIVAPVTGSPILNITSVTSGTVGVGQALSGGSLTPTTIIGFQTFNGTSGTVVVATPQTLASSTTVTAISSYPDKTVKGVVYLDGTYYVMTPSGSIHGSNINDPTAWDSLNVIQSQSEPDTAVCLARQLNLVVSFGAYSTEFFYNAANATGSPLLPYTSAFLEVGCASANSVINAENSIIFMSVGRQKGREIAILEGTAPRVISTPYVNRLLNADNLQNVSSYFIKVQGHGFYILNLPSSDLTLVYDTVSSQWASWTALTKTNQTNIVATTMSWSNGTVTATFPSHNIVDGDFVEITGVTPSGYNGEYVCNKLDDNRITYTLATNPGTYTTGGIAKKYNESAFSMSSYTKSASFDLVQDSTTGVIYSVSTGAFKDGTAPIKYGIRTSKIDGETNHIKFYSRLELLGDTEDATAYLRFTDDDYINWSKYRPIDLSSSRPQLYSLGASRRRAYEIINYDDKPIRLTNLEITADKGFT